MHAGNQGAWFFLERLYLSGELVCELLRIKRLAAGVPAGTVPGQGGLPVPRGRPNTLVTKGHLAAQNGEQGSGNQADSAVSAS